MFAQMSDDVAGHMKVKTNLIQLLTDDPSEGPRLISTTHPMGVPIYVLVDNPSCCYCRLDVPSGIVTLKQAWGRHAGVFAPGCHCCVCTCRTTVAAMITKNSVRFSSPVSTHPN